MTPINASALFGPRVGRGRRSLLAPLGAVLRGSLAALAVTTVAIPPVAMAGDLTRVVVRSADLDLTDPRDVAQLGRRVTLAARRICLGPETIRHLYSNPHRCIAEVVSTAWPQVEQVVARSRAAIVVSAQPAETPSR
jgi:UrcA family protein